MASDLVTVGIRVDANRYMHRDGVKEVLNKNVQHILQFSKEVSSQNTAFRNADDPRNHVNPGLEPFPIDANEVIKEPGRGSGGGQEGCRRGQDTVRAAFWSPW